MIRTRITGKDSSNIEGEQNYVAVNGPDGAATKTIMDRRETNRRTEDYFWLERLGELSGQALMVFDKSLNLEYCNALTNELFGLSDADFERLTCYDDLIEYCVARGDFGEGSETTLKALTEDLITNARLQAPKQTADWKITTPAGKHLSFSQGYGRDGRMLVTIRDITDRVVTERALDIAMNVGSAGYWVYNFETNSWKTSFKNFEQLMGAERIRQAETGNFSCLMHPDDRQQCEDAWNDAIRSKESWNLQTRIVDASGNSFHLKFNGVPQISDTGRISSMFCYFVNITNEIEAQEKQQQVLEKAQKALKAKNEILARLSHDVRTPMNAVIGISDALLHHHPDPVTKPKLELIQNSAEKIIKIVDGTLDHSKMEEEKVSLVPEPTDPKACVEMVCRLWEDQAKKNNTKLTYSFDPSLPAKILMDGFRYEQCLNNLLSNAVKFTQGGQVHVVLTTITKPGVPARLVLAVKDNGIGMTPKQQSQIFEPYTQADESISSRFGGTGLGMTITKQIAELMGGSIKVKSAEGEGTVFVIAIPFKECSASDASPLEAKNTPDVKFSQSRADSPRPEALAATPQPAQKPEPVKAVEPQERSTPVAPDIMPEQTSPATSASLVNDMLAASPQKQGNTEDNTPYSDLRLLVVDDNATNHMVVSSLLGSVVGSIVTASDGQEAIDQLESQDFDVVLMDIHMPVMDGIEATLSIRGSGKPYAEIPIIALTADPQYQQKRLCRNIGMDEALAKPVKLTELLSAFETISPKLAKNSRPQNVIQKAG